MLTKINGDKAMVYIPTKWALNFETYMHHIHTCNHVHPHMYTTHTHIQVYIHIHTIPANLIIQQKFGDKIPQSLLL